MVKISVDLPDEVAEALSRAAASLQSTREAVLIEAAKDFLAGHDPSTDFVGDRATFEAVVAEGEADMAAGREIPHEEVMAEMRAWAAELRRRAPRR